MMRLWIWTGLAALLGFLLGLAPLFDVLGYELALATSLFATIAGLDLGAAFARQRQREVGPIALRSRHAGRALAASTLVAAGRAAAVAAIPGVIAAVHGIWVQTCDWGFGIQAYLAMPLASAALAGALGHTITAAVGTRAHRSWKPHRATVLAQLAWVVLALGAGWRFYSEPPVFVFSPVIGYFPGNLYDENVQLGAALAWSRLEAALWLVALVALVASRFDVPTFRLRWREPRPATRRIGALVVAALALAGALALRLQAGDLGYAVDADDIETALGGRLETPHFIIYYARTPEIEADLPLIAADHEFRYAEVVAQLGEAPDGKLRSFYFASTDDKARWVGARNVEMAKPWLHAILIDHRAFPHGSLRHEIAHAVASAFGDPIFGVATEHLIFANPGLIEGLAVAIDWPGSDGPLTPHQAVRAMQELGYEPSLRELMGLKFLSVSSARGYTTAGSFVRFLLDRYGAARLRALYRSGGDYDGAYGRSFGELEAEWKQMIGAIELPPGVVEATRERFRGGSVFSRPCPHAIAARREQAAEAYGRGDRTRAVALLRHVCGDAPDEPRYQLELGDFLVSGGEAERAEAERLWTAIASSDGVSSSVRADALDRLARTAAIRGDMATTTALVARAFALPLDGSARRLRDAEQLALHHDGPAATALRSYFFAAGTSRDAPMWAQLAALAEPNLGLARYLVGFQRYNAGDWRGAATELLAALDRGLPNDGFVAQAARMLAVAGYRTHDVAQVQRAIAALHGPTMTEVDHLLGDDWERRLAFDATGHL
ncbi:MAG TPA: hypothetical protein VGF94_08865 [Kofleriaceae bacterium]|jgi:hypothetical protein